MRNHRALVPVGIKEAFYRCIKSTLEWLQMLRSNCARTNIQRNQAHLGLVMLPYVRVNVCAKLAEFDALLQKTARVFAQARLGAMIEALANSKPLSILPRFYILREHIKEHQLGIVCEITRKLNVFDCKEGDTTLSEDL